MHRFLIAIALILIGVVVAPAQGVPHDFKQDTPPVPGQVVETPRDKLRLVPIPLRQFRDDEIGLPSSGPKGIVRASRNDERYAPPANR
jgi:hypothetical protein